MVAKEANHHVITTKSFLAIKLGSENALLLSHHNGNSFFTSIIA